jgi:hypothetical protein
MPLMDRDDYFVRQGKLIWDKGKVVLRVRLPLFYFPNPF